MMEKNDKLIKDILSVTSREQAPDLLYTKVMHELESQNRAAITKSQPLLPVWVWFVIGALLIISYFYFNTNTTTSSIAWLDFIKGLSIPHLDWSISVESRLLSQISRYMLFLVPALLLQFIYINYYINRFKKVDIK